MTSHPRFKDYAVEHDRIVIQPGRFAGYGNVKRSLALTGLVIGGLLLVAGLVFWNALLPFYGLACLAGAV